MQRCARCDHRRSPTPASLATIYTQESSVNDASTRYAPVATQCWYDAIEHERFVRLVGLRSIWRRSDASPINHRYHHIQFYNRGLRTNEFTRQPTMRFHHKPAADTLSPRNMICVKTTLVELNTDVNVDVAWRPAETLVPTDTSFTSSFVPSGPSSQL